MDKILQFFSDNKDALTAIGIILTFSVSVISLYFSVRNNKAVHYVNSITKSRLEWIDGLRKLAVDFCNACDMYEYRLILDESQKPDTENMEFIKRTAMQIKLMLNYADEFDKKIIKVIDKLEKLTTIYYDAFECINHYLDEDGHLDFESYSIQNLWQSEPYVQNYIVRFCKIKELPIDELHIFNRREAIADCVQMIEEDDVMWQELNINFIADTDNILYDINECIKTFSKYIQIYLKSEWNRVKYESQGKTYEKETQEFDVWELEQKYDNPEYKNNVWKRFCINSKAKVNRIWNSSGFSVFVFCVSIIILIIIVPHFVKEILDAFPK